MENYMITFVRNRVCNRGNEYFCYLCKYSDSNIISMLKHITHDEEHQQRREIGVIGTDDLLQLKIDETKSNEIVSNSIVLINSQKFYCIKCSCAIPTIAHFTDHINGLKHSTIQGNKPSHEHHEPSVKNDNCMPINPAVKIDHSNFDNLNAAENFKLVPVYFCATCRVTLKSNAAVRYHTMFHLSEEEYIHRDIIHFSVQERNVKLIHCLMCNFETDNEEQLENHLKGDNHKKRLIFLSQSKYIYSTNLSVPPSITRMPSPVSTDKTTTIIYKSTFCQICDVPVPSDPQDTHIRGKRHAKSLSTFLQHNKIFKSTLISDDHSPTYSCFLCQNEYTDEKSLFNHYNRRLHECRMKSIKLILQDENITMENVDKNIVLNCIPCDLKIHDLPTMVNHILGTSHGQKLKCLITNPTKTKRDFIELNSTGSEKLKCLIPNNSTTMDENFSPKSNEFSTSKCTNDASLLQNINDKSNLPVYSCPICDVYVVNDFMLNQHLNSKKHKKKVTRYVEGTDSTSLNIMNFVCPTCNDTFCSDTQLIEHLSSVKHTSNVEIRLNKKTQSTTSDTQSLKSCNSDCTYTSFSLDNLEEPNVLLDKLIDFTIGGKEKNVLPLLRKNKAPRKPNESPSNNESSKYLRHLSDFGERYITMCIEPGDKNIFNVNPEKLHKLQLGINLSFPINSNRACIPCGQEIPSDPQLVYQHLNDEQHIKNLQALEEADMLFEDFEDQFSDLKLAKSYMQESSDELVTCFACKVEVANSDYGIQSHIGTYHHLNKSLFFKKSAEEIFSETKNILNKAWYYAEKFICEICSIKFDSDINFAGHLVQKEHLDKVQKALNNHDVLQFDMCTRCVTYWYGKIDGYNVHCNGSFHKYLLKAQDYGIPSLWAPIKGILNRYESTIDSLLNVSNSVDQSIEMDLLESVQKITKVRYPKAEAYLFGSRLSGIGSCDSDLDIYLDCENNYHDSQSIEKPREQLLEIEKCFEGHKDIWIIEEVLLTARVPILKLRHRATNLNCDISCTNGLSVRKSRLIR